MTIDCGWDGCDNSDLSFAIGIMSGVIDDAYELGELSLFDFFDAFSLGGFGSVRMMCSFLLMMGAATGAGVVTFLLRDRGFGFGFVGGGIAFVYGAGEWPYGDASITGFVILLNDALNPLLLSSIDDAVFSKKLNVDWPLSIGYGLYGSSLLYSPLLP